MADLVDDNDERFRPPAAPSGQASQPSAMSTRKKRSGYIPQACINCRKRKVKCSGGATCTECSKAGETCLYTDRRRKRRSDGNHSPRVQRWHSFEDDSSTVELSNHVISMTARLSSLERHYSQLRTAVTTSRKAGGESVVEHHPTAPTHSVSHSASSQLAPSEPGQTQQTQETQDGQESQPAQQAQQSQAHAVAAAPQDDFPELPSGDMVEYGLDGSMPLQGEFASVSATDGLDQEKGSTQHEDLTPTQNDPGILEGFLPPGPSPVMIKDVDPFQVEREVRLNNGASFRPSFDIFFRRLNPLHPLLNENQFRSQFDTFVFDHGHGLSDLDQAQLLVLVNLIHAEVEILIGDCSESDAIFGWREFCTADNILQDLIWKGKANLMTIQCLLLKTRYLLYLERFNLAYDMMATAVRICMQLGLHDQSRWPAQGADPFEMIMRQRVFYSLFTLERAVSLSCGLPPVLRQSDFYVEAPPALDDRGLFPHRPLPEETPEHSFVPYFIAIIKWAELCGDLWDSMLHMGAPKPVSESQIAVLDVKILDLVRSVPPQLQWRVERGNAIRGRMDPYVWRQQVMYRVRMNAMRLRIRQDTMSRLSFDNKMANEVVQIAQGSIDTLKDCRTSADPTDRYFSTIYLVGVITPLSCIIVKDEILPDLRAEAVVSWKAAVQLLQEIARDFDLARRLLQRFHGVIKMADLIVVSQNNGTNSNPNYATGHPALPELPNEVAEGDDGTAVSMSGPAGATILNEHQHLLFPLSHLPTPAAGNDQPFGSGVGFDSDYWMGTTW